MSTGSKFVCVFNGRRDSYQVAVALAERDALEALVTDLYMTPQLSWVGRIFPALGRRKAASIGDRVVSQPLLTMVQLVGAKLGIPEHLYFGFIDGKLAAAAQILAARRKASLLCYAGYGPKSGRRPRATKTIVFQHHPLSGTCDAILADDFTRWPQLTWSRAREQPPGAVRFRQDNDWRSADRVICASSFTRRSLIEAGCPAERITVVPYGTDLRNEAGPTPKDSDHTHFLFVGQGVQRKGTHHLIKAWINAELPNATLTFVCYTIDPALEAEARRAGIRLVSHLSAEELHGEFRRAHAFVMPSLVEGFGLVYLEALAAGCFVIGTPNTGLPDLPLSADTHRLVPAADVDALARALSAVDEARASGRLDPRHARADAAKWTWADFRSAVAAACCAHP